MDDCKFLQFKLIIVSHLGKISWFKAVNAEFKVFSVTGKSLEKSCSIDNPSRQEKYPGTTTDTLKIFFCFSNS